MRIGIRTNDPTILDRLISKLPPDGQVGESDSVDCLVSLWISPQACKPHYFYLDRKRMIRTTDLDALLNVVEAVLQLHVAEYAPHRIFVHAGVVGWKGHALVLPGRSLAGKSTLVEALVQAGATYYSDEYAVLDDQGQVYPYARRLSLRSRRGQLPWRCTAEDLGGQRGFGPLPVSLIVVTKYREGGHWQPRSVAAGQTFLALIDHTISARTYPERVLTALQGVASRARMLKSWRGEAEETAAVLLTELTRR